MKKLNQISKILLLLLACVSCKKESFQVTTKDVEKEETKIRATGTAIAGISNCYKNLLMANYDAITLANSIPVGFSSFTNSALSAQIDNNFSTLMSCISNSPGEEGEPQPIEPGVQGSSYGPDPAEVFSVLSQSYRYTPSGTDSYLAALVQAYDYVLAQNYVLSPHERMVAIGSAIYTIDVDDILINTGYHGAMDNRIYYIVEAIQILSGVTPITSAQYNTYIASGPSEFVQFPAARNAGWIGLKANSNNPQLWASVYPISITNSYSTVSYYSTVNDVFATSLTLDMGVPIYYSSATQKLYADSNHTTYVADGYYGLPSSGFTAFERNNYLVLIQNGVVVSAYAGE